VAPILGIGSTSLPGVHDDKGDASGRLAMLTGRRAPQARLGRALVWVVIGGFLALAVVAMAVGLRDPTEETFFVTLRNDTGRAVVLKQCDVTCNSFHGQFELRPDESGPVNTTASDTPNWWMVRDASGKTLGCLLLRFDHKQPGLVVDISHTTTCPP